MSVQEFKSITSRGILAGKEKRLIMNYFFPKLLLASNNPKKAVELKAIFSELAQEVLTLADFPGGPEPVEDGLTYAQNAEKKARFYAEKFKLPTLADDSGLEVEFLKGEPGINSARFLGKQTPWVEKNKKMLELLKNVSHETRKARFVCNIALVLPGGEIIRAAGELPGEIGYQLTGSYGFGYDPIFYLPEQGKYLAELPGEEKNKISHRAGAMQDLRKILAQSRTVSFDLETGYPQFGEKKPLLLI